MPIVRILDVRDIERYRARFIYYIFDSFKNTLYMDTYTIKDAEDKYGDLLLHASHKKAIVCGAIEDNELIGFIWAYKYPFRDDHSRLYISILHIDEEYRSMNIGSQLLFEIEAYARQEKIHAIYLHAEAFNTGALRFYQRNGYEFERIQMVKKELKGVGDL